MNGVSPCMEKEKQQFIWMFERKALSLHKESKKWRTIAIVNTFLDEVSQSYRTSVKSEYMDAVICKVIKSIFELDIDIE